MRDGTVIVNGTNLYTTYGAFVAKGGYNEIVQWPSLKAVDGNDWQEYDGFEPDLSNPVLDSRDVNIKFVLKGKIADISSFYAFLGSSPTMTYNFSDIGRTLSLRLVSMPSLAYAKTFHNMTCLFAADIPLEGYSYLAPVTLLGSRLDVRIDGTPISDYGVRLLKGTVNAEIKKPAVKPLLIRNIGAVAGATYDENPTINDPDNELTTGYEYIGDTYKGVSGTWKRSTTRGNLTYQARQITLKCQISGDASSVWRNYDALLYDLSKADDLAADATKKGARVVYLHPLQRNFNCYYGSQKVTDFVYSDGYAWIKFDLTLNVFEELDEVAFVLAKEENLDYIITESGEKIEIDIDISF